MSFSFPQTKTTSYSNTLNIIFALIFFTCLLIVFNMIANLSTILYIMSVSEQVLSNKILQKGTAACKINSAGDILNIQLRSGYLTVIKNPKKVKKIVMFRKFNQTLYFFSLANSLCCPTDLLNSLFPRVKTYKLKRTKCPSVSPSFIYWGR